MVPQMATFWYSPISTPRVHNCTSYGRQTTLVKEGISKILGRDFAFIALGGATDSSFLEGHKAKKQLWPLWPLWVGVQIEVAYGAYDKRRKIKCY